jgi:hypothetical protein
VDTGSGSRWPWLPTALPANRKSSIVNRKSYPSFPYSLLTPGNVTTSIMSACSDPPDQQGHHDAIHIRENPPSPSPPSPSSSSSPPFL